MCSGSGSGSAVDPISALLPSRYRVVVYRVESEDPWRARVVESRGGLSWEEAAGLHARIVGEYEGEGFSCFEEGASTHVLCVRVRLDGGVPVAVERFLVVVEPEEG